MRQVVQRLVDRFAEILAWRGGAWARRLLAAALLLAAAAVGLDRQGLEATYISHVGERPIWTRADSGLRIEPDLPAAIFRYPRLFRVRWSGWLEVPRAGVHRFRIDSSGPTRLLVDGRELVALERERESKPARLELGAGLRRIEMEFVDRGAPVSFSMALKPPGGDWQPLTPARLYPERPGPLRRLARRALAGTSVVLGRLIATVLVLAAFLLLRRDGERALGVMARGRIADWAARPERRRWLGLAGLATLAAVAGVAIFSRTGSPFGWDDVRYLDLAVSGREEPAYLNRFAHVYLVKLFVWIAGGDPFLAARVFWSVQFGLIVASLAAAARSLVGRWWNATFLLSFFLLFCQPLFFLRAGASVPDTTVATLLMMAAALFLDRAARGAAGRFEWQVLLIGAMTVWAIKSKELGAILLWLAMLLLFEGGKLDWRSFGRKAAHWMAGAAAALALLMALDLIYFGDPLQGLRPANLAAVGELNFADDPQKSRETEGWIDVVGQGRSPVTAGNPRMRYMALLVVLAALVVAYRRRSLELRLLHLLPLAYVLLLMLIHLRATYVFLARYLYPIVPLSCFLVAAGFHYLGLDDLRWRDLRRPGFLAAVAALVFVLFGIALPYEAGRLEAASFLPSAWLTDAGWTSLDAVVRLVAAPSLVLVLVLVLALVQHQRPWRLLLLLALVVLFLGLPFRRTVQDLGMSRPWQRGETHLHALRVLGDRIPERPGVKIEVSQSLMRQEQMFGVEKTCGQIVKLYLRRRDPRVVFATTLDESQDVAFLTAENWEYWRRAWPALEATAVRSPGGEVILVRPAEAGSGGSDQAPEAPPSEPGLR